MSKRKSMSSPWEDLTSAAKRVRHISTVSNSLSSTLFPSTEPKHLAFMTSLHTIVVKAIRHKRCVAETLDGYTCRKDITPKAVLHGLELLDGLTSDPMRLMTVLNRIAVACCCRQERLRHNEQAPEIAQEWVDEAGKLCKESVRGFVKAMQKDAGRPRADRQRMMPSQDLTRFAEVDDDGFNVQDDVEDLQYPEEEGEDDEDEDDRRPLRIL